MDKYFSVVKTIELTAIELATVLLYFKVSLGAVLTSLNNCASNKAVE